jgi:hypothetical protein
MNPISAFSTIRNDLVSTYNLPLPVSICLKALSVVHWVWWLRRKKEMVKSENIVPAIFGTGLDIALRFSPPVIEKTLRGVAKLILVANRIDECRERMQSLAKGFTRLKNAISGKYSEFPDPQWIKVPQSRIFSLQTLNAWQSRKRKSIAYFKRIYYCVTSLFVKIFKLGMHMWDAYHAIVLSHDAVPEVFVNGRNLYRQMRDNKEHFFARLEDYKPLIQKIFTATHMPSKLTAHRLIKTTKRVFEKIDSGVKIAEEVKKCIAENAMSMAKTVETAFKTLNINSKRLYEGLESPPVHTPFVLNNRCRNNYDSLILSL